MEAALKKAKLAPIVNVALCVGCGSCQSVCPANPNVYEMDDVARVVNPQACTECGACVEICPVQAIELNEFDETP